MIISVSDDWGMTKAEARAFSRLRDLVQGDIVHVGDHLDFDYRVPRSIGIKAYHVRRDQGPKANGSLVSLREFAVRIKGE
jgi:FMN phosphatase YigB (HAD superfamily)